MEARRSKALAAPTVLAGAFNFYEKRAFPKFNGKKREYLSFRREWTQIVEPKYRGQEYFLVKYPNCTMEEHGVVCNKRHNHLLHGATTKYCNIARAGSSRLPTSKEIQS